MFMSSFFQVTPNPFPDITFLKRLVSNYSGYFGRFYLYFLVHKKKLVA